MNATIDDLRAAYRIFLGRDPDPSGLAHFSTMIATGVSLAQLRDIFLASEEFSGGRRPRVQPIEIFPGMFVSVDTLDPEFGSAIVTNRTWEPHLIEIIKANLSEGQTFVDIGANVGVMSFVAASRVGSTGKVVSFEPDATNFARFVEGLALNGFHNVMLHQIALTDTRTILSLAGGSNAHLSGEGDRMVQAAEGDDFLKNEPRVDFMKLDIEGFEPKALAGLTITLKQHKPLILCEFNPRCLHSHASMRPMDFATEIFALTNTVAAIEHSGRQNKIETAADLMSLWDTRNQEAVSSRLLPDGMLHFDLLFRPA